MSLRQKQNIKLYEVTCRLQKEIMFHVDFRRQFSLKKIEENFKQKSMIDESHLLSLSQDEDAHLKASCRAQLL